VLDDAARHTEDVLLRIRLSEGLSLSALSAVERQAAEQARADGLFDKAMFDEGRAVLTLRGRLLADAVVRALLD